MLVFYLALGRGKLFSFMLCSCSFIALNRDLRLGCLSPSPKFECFVMKLKQCLIMYGAKGLVIRHVVSFFKLDIIDVLKYDCAILLLVAKTPARSASNSFAHDSWLLVASL